MGRWGGKDSTCRDCGTAQGWRDRVRKTLNTAGLRDSVDREIGWDLRDGGVAWELSIQRVSGIEKLSHIYNVMAKSVFENQFNLLCTTS